MLRAVAIVLVLVVVCGYLALFLSWNATPQPVTTLQLGASSYEQAMPVGLLFIVGVLVGAIAMALALWNPWIALKATQAQQQELIQRAKSKLKSQDAKIKELTRNLEELASSMESDEDDMGLAPEAKAAAAEVEASADEPAKVKAAAAQTPEDDPEVI
jgi:uncharacterized membrane-anchored protein YhcB (DUF1043 family)